MVYTPQHVANYFLDRASAEGRGVSPLKLLKLVYIAYGWYLALKNEKLFREPIEAWQHGPVVPSIYHEFKHCGSSPITDRSVTVDFLAGPNKLTFVTPHIPEDDSDANIILDKVWQSYRDFTAWKLRDMTHEDDTPWSRVYAEGSRGTQLTDEDIREHYLERIGQYIDAAGTKASEETAS